MRYNLVERDDFGNITVVVDGQMYTADDAHPHWEAIKEAVRNDDESVVDLFDVTVKAAKVFERLTERLTVANSRVYIDGDEVDDVYADTLVSFLEEGVDDEDREALVNFLDKVYSNTEKHTRDNLSRWLKATGGFTFTNEGNIVGYKGLSHDRKSIHSGPGIVDGVEQNGHLANEDGSIVEMARSQVEHNPAVGCAQGLHVGTWDYARSFGTVVVEVEVNPRDVVSVPTDCNGQKMRVSRYKVVRVVNEKHEETVIPSGFVPGEDYLDGYDEGYEDGSEGEGYRY